MAFYYGLLGLIADLALAMNLVLIVALIIAARCDADLARYCRYRVNRGYGRRCKRIDL